MRRVIFLLKWCLLTSCLVFALVSCNTTTPTPTPEDPNKPHKTVVLSSFAGSTLKTLSENGTKTKLVFEVPEIMPMSTPAEMQIDDASQLEVGDIIVSAPTEEAPYGLMLKVEGIDEEGNTIYIETSQASLEEAIAGSNLEEGDYTLTSDPLTLENASLLYDPTIVNLNSPSLQSPDSLYTSHQSDLSEFSPQWRGGYDPPEQCFTKTLTDGTKTADARACVNFSAFVSFDIRVGVGWWGFIPRPRLDYLEAKTGGSVSGSINLSARNTMPIVNKKILLRRISLGVTTLWLGPMPVVITPVYDIYLNMNGQITVETSASTSLSMSGEIGIKYDRFGGGWSPIAQFNSNFSAPSFSSSATLNLQVSVAANKLTFYLYGAVGPFAEVEPYVKMNYQFLPRQGTITAGIRGNVGVQVKVLFIDQSYYIVRNNIVPEFTIARF
jgi:hypothetical protein